MKAGYPSAAVQLYNNISKEGQVSRVLCFGPSRIIVDIGIQMGTQSWQNYT